VSGGEARDVLERIYRRDTTLWKPDDPEHQQVIASSLGWVDIVDRMRPHLDEIRVFAEESRERFDTVVLLGMGGSSLCPEVYRRVFGRQQGWPELIVLDSVVPEAVREVEGRIDLTRTLFVVASKSGGTIEPSSLYKRFRGLVEEKGGDAGSHFIAITDPGSPLQSQAEASGFLRVFLNFADIGGRYSALSFFGMVPAALCGLDVAKLLDRAEEAFRDCAPEVAGDANPAWLLGSMAGASALSGRNKLTLLLPEAYESLGLWIEQLVAESTGKEGKGIVPVAGEPPLAAEDYGDDRLFVVVAGDDGETTEDPSLRTTHPVFELPMRDPYDLAWHFAVWELATAVMGVFLAINPFDQPNVEEAKEQAKQALETLPRIDPASDEELLALCDSLKGGDYLALLIYARETDERNGLIEEIRSEIAFAREIATTAGYGPRYLHSTGQLHKGGGGEGAYVLLTCNDDEPMQVPGEAYSLNRLAMAQAVGDARALKAKGRRLVHLHGPDLGELLTRVRQCVAQ
jgi:glucose-6-phosphate isomerase